MVRLLYSHVEQFMDVGWPQEGEVTLGGIILCVHACFSCVQLFVTPWTVTFQAPMSMGFSRQECLSGLPFPFPGYLSNPGPISYSSCLAGRFFTAEPQGKPIVLFD